MALELAAKFTPYLWYFIYAQLVLMCLAILVGGFLFLKRVASRQAFDGRMEFDHERIAREMTEEINRLTELRNRIFPPAAGSETAAGSASATLTGDSARTTGDGLGAAEVDRLVQQAVTAKQKEFDTQIAELRRKLSEAEAAMAAAGGGSSAANDPALQQEISKLKDELTAKTKATEEARTQATELQNQLKTAQEAAKSAVGAGDPNAAAQVEELNTKVSVLESALAEYEIFEEEFALVKKYKKENEELRQQLAAAGGPKASEAQVQQAAQVMGASVPANVAPVAAAVVPTNTPTEAEAPLIGEGVTSDAIADMFNQMVSEGESAATTGDAMEPLFQEEPALNSVPVATPVETPSTTPASTQAVSTPEQAAAATTGTATGTATPAAQTQSDSEVKASVEPIADPLVAADSPSGMVVDEATAEAVASAGADQGDELIAEFEKLLGGKQ